MKLTVNFSEVEFNVINMLSFALQDISPLILAITRYSANFWIATLVRVAFPIAYFKVEVLS